MAATAEAAYSPEEFFKTNLSLSKLLTKIIQAFETFKQRWSCSYSSPAELLDGLIEWMNGASDSLETQIRGASSQYIEMVKTWINEQKEVIEVIVKSLQQDYFVQPRERRTKEYKAEQARYGQTLAQYYLRAQAYSKERKMPVYFLSQLVSSLSRLRIDHVEMYGKLNNGAKAQAGICGALSKEHTVVLPDTSDKSDDIENWDLRGVDFVVIADDEVLLIDAKSRGGYFAEVNIRENKVKSARKIAYQALVSAYGQEVCDRMFGQDYQESRLFTNLKIRSLVVTVPTHKEHMDAIGNMTSEQELNLKQALFPEDEVEKMASN